MSLTPPSPRPAGAGAAADDDDAPTCWICHSLADDSGPLVRDCSCRGNSGHAHLSCIVEYAEHQSASRDAGKFILAWTNCPNCLQGYEGDLAAELVQKCTAFVDRDHPDDRWFVCHKIYVQLRSMKIDPTCQPEAERLAGEIIAIVGQMRADAADKLDEPVPTPFLYYEVTAHESLGLFAEAEGTKERLKEAMERYQKVSDIYKEIGVPLDSVHADACVARARSKYNDDGSFTVEHRLKDCRDYYTEAVAESGKDSMVSLISLWRLADALRDAHRRIEAIRTLKEVHAAAKRIHGTDHTFTKDVVEALARYNRRQVIVKGWPSRRFRALRYLPDENKYEVRGPIPTKDKPGEEKTFTVHKDEVRPTWGTPVLCCGLEENAHLNGKIADVRSREKGTLQYKVHFDDKNIEPCVLHPRNFRILFEIPEEEQEGSLDCEYGCVSKGEST